MKIAKSYRDDEYYTTKETAEKFFELVVKPSGILKHKTLLMPFTTLESPLYIVATQYHDHIITFTGDMDLWKKAGDYEDVAVVDNPPFSLSASIEKYYFEKDIPFVLFRSAVSYPKFIYKQDKAGIIYENSVNGVAFSWGIGKYIEGDEYIRKKYPNLIDNVKAVGALRKRIPIGFSFYQTDYQFKVKTITFSVLKYPIKKDCCIYLNRGIFDENTKIWIDEKDKRIHLLSY
ncbi:hypothetical protein ACOY2N_10575 [Enterococcus faecium]|uniref:hypothetical protein n=1 Tax=Enterococcus faecium TaxID=1352 RepID=UPI003CE5936B